MSGNNYKWFLKGLSQKEISLKYLVHKSTICRIITSGDINVCHKGGRPRLTTAREERKIAVFFKKNSVATAKEAKMM